MASENIHGYAADLSAATRCSRSMVGFATKDGIQYQYRRYLSPVQPGSGSSTSFDAFGRQKARVYTHLRSIFGADPHIQLPSECLPHDGHWFSFTQWPDECTPDEDHADLIATLSIPERIKLIETAARTLSHLHRHSIVHGNLTANCVMPIFQEGHCSDAKLVGLEDAFFEDAIPDHWQEESAPYAAPEQAFAYSSENIPQKQRSITTQADIFSLGLILHEFLSGCLPLPDISPSMPKQGHPWQILTTSNPDGSHPQLVVSPQITDPCLIALISDMLHPDPAHRPKAEAVLHRLTHRILPIESKTWPGDGITINPEVARKQVIGLRKYIRSHRSAPAEQLYEIIHTDGRRTCLTARQLIRLGIVSVMEIVDPPWPNDQFRWDEEKLKTMFVCTRRGPQPGLYQMIDKAGGSRQCTARQLKMLGFAIPTRGRSSRSAQDSAISPTRGINRDGLWAEDHQLQLNPPEIASLGLFFSGPVELCGIRGYQFTDAGGNSRFITQTGCRLLNLLVPK